MTEIGDVGARYLELALRLRRLEPDVVECYTGPDLREQLTPWDLDGQR